MLVDLRWKTSGFTEEILVLVHDEYMLENVGENWRMLMNDGVCWCLREYVGVY